MNEKQAKTGSLTVVITVLIFAVCLIISFDFGSFLACMFLAFGFMMMTAGFACESGRHLRAASILAVAFA